MKTKHFFNFLSLGITSLFIAILLACDPGKDCNCSVVSPQNLQVKDFQTDGIVFEWQKIPQKLQYELLVRQEDGTSHPEKVYAFTHEEADPAIKLIKYDEFVKKGHLYSAKLRTLCPEVMGCSNKDQSQYSAVTALSSVDTDSIKCSAPTISLDTVQNGQAFVNFTPVPGALGYIFAVTDSAGNTTYINFPAGTVPPVPLPLGQGGITTIVCWAICPDGSLSNTSNVLLIYVSGGGGGTIVVIVDDLDVVPATGCGDDMQDGTTNASGCISLKEYKLGFCPRMDGMAIDFTPKNVTCTIKRTEIVQYETVAMEEDVPKDIYLYYYTGCLCKSADYSCTFRPFDWEAFWDSGAATDKLSCATDCR